jgi:hypothetical protein
MAGMMGGAPQNQVVSSGDLIAVVTPKGDRVGVYTEGGSMKLYRVPAGVKATPIITNGSFVSLFLDGEKISQLAAYSRELGDWSTLDLKKPVKGPVMPIEGNGFSVTRAGRYLCAFSGEWSVVDLGDDFKEPQKAGGMMSRGGMMGGMMSSMSPDQDGGFYGPVVGNETAFCRSGRHVYAYSATAGKWDVADLGDEGGPPPVLSGKFITASSDKGLFVFDAKTGKWQGHDLSDDKDKDAR